MDERKIMNATENMLDTLDIDRCNECHNPEFEYVDYTSKTVCECTQCKTKFYLEKE